MTTRRRFTGEFKANVALEALRGDKRSRRSRHKLIRTKWAGSSGRWRK